MSKPLGGKSPQREPGQEIEAGQDSAPAAPKPKRTVAAAAPAKLTGGKAIKLEWFRVQAEAEISSGPGRTRLPTGKIINSASFKIGDLKAQGVKLEPVDEPAWYSNAQGDEEEDEAGAVA